MVLGHSPISGQISGFLDLDEGVEVCAVFEAANDAATADFEAVVDGVGGRVFNLSASSMSSMSTSGFSILAAAVPELLGLKEAKDNAGAFDLITSFGTSEAGTSFELTAVNFVSATAADEAGAFAAAVGSTAKSTVVNFAAVAGVIDAISGISWSVLMTSLASIEALRGSLLGLKVDRKYSLSAQNPKLSTDIPAKVGHKKLLK